MTLTITMICDNSAFHDEGAGLEVARILRALASKLEDWPGENEFTIGLRDANGNKVGEAKATKS